MKTLKLQKVKSYSGLIRVTEKNPVVSVDDETAAALLATGYFIECDSEPKTVEPETPEKTDVDYEKLAQMTKAQLTEIAEQNQIDIEKCRTKADILETISVACGGNYTMIELQRK